MKAIFRMGRTALMALMASVALLAGSDAFAQTAVKGKVIDANGEPVIGAAVMVPNTTTGTMTDVNGSFSLSVAPGTSLEVSCIGYTTVTVAAAANLTVVLQEDSEMLEETVVVGYGAITKKSLSTAISTVQGDKIANMPTSTMAQALVGMSSGITFQQINGQPGTAPSIRIRGAGSINSGLDPLYVIDGYPTTDSQLFNNLNPSDIADVQILKDAAASAIYGSKAGNGVIIVTTKQGKAGKPQITFSAQVGMSQPQKYVDVLHSKDFLEMVIEANQNSGRTAYATLLQNLLNSGNYVDTDWQKEIFRNALNVHANVNITGGSETVRYNFAAGWQNEDGILLNSGFKKYNFKGGFDANLGRYVKVGASFAPTFSTTRSQSPSGGNTEDRTGIVAEALTAPPIYPVYQPNGDYTQASQHYPDYGFNSQWRNPVCNLLENMYDSTSLRTLTNAYVEVTPIKGLTIRSSLNFNTNNSKSDNYMTGANLSGKFTGNKSTPELSIIGGSRSSSFNYNLYWSSTITYKTTIADKHNINAVAGYDYEYNSGFSTSQSTRTDSDHPNAFENSDIHNVNGATLFNGSSSNSEYRFDAMFARLIYDYDSKYVLSASIRRDRSSKFGPDNRAGMFYSVSGAWNINQENFLRDAKWLNILKIRASYGITGNDQVGNYAWLSSISKSSNLVFGTNVYTTYSPSGYGNTELGWETNRQIDLGLDFGVFNRINLTVDYYKRLSDIVMSAQIPNFNGISGSISKNSGQIQNRGLEIQLSARPFVGEFTWQTTLSYSLNRNKILSLADNATQLSNQSAGSKWGNVMRNYVGRPMGDMYMYKVIGTFNTEEDLKKAKKGTQALGDLMFEDVDNSGSITASDMQFVGNYQPKFTYGWTNNFSYKNFDLAVTIDGSYGGKVIFAAARAFTLNRYDDNVLAESGLGRWKSAADPGNGKSNKAGTANLGSNIDASTRYLYDSSYLRIRNVALGYNLPKSVCQKIKLQGVRFSVNFQNLYTFDSYPGYSVESNYSGNSSTNNGVDFGSYPLSRVMTLGVNINF